MIFGGFMVHAKIIKLLWKRFNTIYENMDTDPQQFQSRIRIQNKQGQTGNWSGSVDKV